MKFRLHRMYHRMSEEEQKKAKKYAKEQRDKTVKNGITNREICQSEQFQQLCKKHNVYPTNRQASKYRNNFGKLYRLEEGM